MKLSDYTTYECEKCEFKFCLRSLELQMCYITGRDTCSVNRVLQSPWESVLEVWRTHPSHGGINRRQWSCWTIDPFQTMLSAQCTIRYNSLGIYNFTVLQILNSSSSIYTVTPAPLAQGVSLLLTYVCLWSFSIDFL